MRNALIGLLYFVLTVPCMAQISGCTDVEARNFNPNATINDGSCKYKRIRIEPDWSVPLNDSLAETSGLLLYDGQLWTHNDNPGNTLFAIDTTGKIRRRVDLGVPIVDWEAISQDSAYFYIGDFGNNLAGNRQDLRILRMSKVSVAANKPMLDTISFAYSNQQSTEKRKANKTNFDCEAFVVTSDSIYLFTKHWKHKKTSLYALPKSPGKHVASYKSTLDVNGLITDATYVESEKLLVLSGYNKRLKPFLYLLYDFRDEAFFSANKRKVFLKLPFHQVEGIVHVKGFDYYLTNEKFVLKPLINTSPKLHQISLQVLLKKYLKTIP